MRNPISVVCLLVLLAAEAIPCGADPSGIELGVGMVRPAIDPARPLYFYLSPDLALDPSQLSPSDSLTFREGTHYVDIGTAPPWLVPEWSKLDYDILLLRAQSLSQRWIEVVVNDHPDRPRAFPRTAWIAREGAQFETWPEFLLGVFSVEPLDPDANPLRSGPGESFPEVAPSADLTLRVVAVQGSWAKVAAEFEDEAGAPPAHGPIRWRSGDRLSPSTTRSQLTLCRTRAPGPNRRGSA
ncbi:MAG: hypothetical protein R3E97_23130 [Candidatus Eisenbacteria bacterium]